MKRVSEYFRVHLMGENHKAGNLWFFLCELCVLCG